MSTLRKGKTMINTELLEQTMRHIIDHPETHDQSQWVSKCGTTACFAGWACLLSGAQLNPKRYLITISWWVTRNNKLIHTQDLATELLGICDDDADRLFRDTYTVDDLQLMVKELINREAS